MPTFHIYKGGNLLGEVVGADIAKVEQLVATVCFYNKQLAGEGSVLGTGRVLGSGDNKNAKNNKLNSIANEESKEPCLLLIGMVVAILVYAYWQK